MKALLKIIGVVVIYKPDIDELIRNINQYIEYLSCLIIWQNSALNKQEKEHILQGLIEEDKVLFQGDGNNVGMAAALNWTIKYAKDKGYDLFMSMDQDSYWVNFKDYLNVIQKENDSSIGIYGPEIIDALNEKRILNNEHHITDEKYVITSGAVYRLDIFEKVGNFKESYFIDALDEEICFRAKKYGFRTVHISDGYLIQKFGNHENVRCFFKEIITPNYSSFRYYYIVRNHIWLAKSGIVPPEYKRNMIRNYILSFPLKAILFERNKIKKIGAISRGLCDGILRSPRER